MANLRYGGYLLIALGLINLRYQTGHHNVLMHSLTIVIPGLILLAATFAKSTQKYLANRTIQIVVGILAALLVAYSFTNK
jgi:VIT1/CCC1 family predicted Fe2+/Mn2+ transporter